MPRYFFHRRKNGQLIPDTEGTEFVDITEADREAIASARELIAEILQTDRPVPFRDTMEVSDDQGACLFSLTFREALD